MKIVFTKGSGKHDHMDVFREGHPPQRIDCPRQGMIPHDMVHFAVEHTLQARGFLGRIKEGRTGGFRMEVEAESDAVERLVEVFQGDAWSGGTTSPCGMLEMYRITCDARRCSPLALDESAILAVRCAIAELTTRWEAVKVGGCMELDL